MSILLSAPLPARAAEVILAFGDSLTAGYGLPAEQAFPAKLEAALKNAGRAEARVVNAGVSGETTSGGLTRLPWVLEQTKPDYAILELGANDMLRAVDPAVTRENLRRMLDIFREKKIPVLLAGMKAFRNLELKSGAFEQVYNDLAGDYDTGFYPFFLEGVASKPELVQEDGLHPAAAGVDVIVAGILPSVQAMLEKGK